MFDLPILQRESASIRWASQAAPSRAVRHGREARLAGPERGPGVRDRALRRRPAGFCHTRRGWRPGSDPPSLVMDHGRWPWAVTGVPHRPGRQHPLGHKNRLRQEQRRAGAERSGGDRAPCNRPIARRRKPGSVAPRPGRLSSPRQRAPRRDPHQLGSAKHKRHPYDTAVRPMRKIYLTRNPRWLDCCVTA